MRQYPPCLAACGRPQVFSLPKTNRGSGDCERASASQVRTVLYAAFAQICTITCGSAPDVTTGLRGFMASNIFPLITCTSVCDQQELWGLW